MTQLSNHMNVRKDLAELIGHLEQRKHIVSFSIIFFSILVGLTYLYPILLPITFASLLILPYGLLVRGATIFNETSYHAWSPTLSNLTNYRVLIIHLIGVMPITGYLLFDSFATWENYGGVSLIIAFASILVFTWSQGLYAKNFYFDRWHIFERGVLVLSGGLVVLSPAFIPLYLIYLNIIISQFDHPEINGFNRTHSTLPYTMLLILSGFVFADFVVSVEPYAVTFLLLCGFAANYFQPGIGKLKLGPWYYLSRNNPMFLFMNAYACGWLSTLDEQTVVKIGQLADKYKLLVNSGVILIEIGIVLVLLSIEVAIVLAIAAFCLHLFIFLLTGVNFWKWMAVNIAIVVGLLIGDVPSVLFEDWFWLILSLFFIVFARGWMKPKLLGWLDSPYTLYYEIKGITKDGNEYVDIDPNIFAPYDYMFSQGISGKFRFLGTTSTPIKRECLGGTRNRDFHEQLAGIFSGEDVDVENLSQYFGDELHDEAKTQNLEGLMRTYVGFTHGEQSGVIGNLLTPPSEFYCAGIDGGYSDISKFDKLVVERVDGVWTDEGLEEVNRETVIQLNIDSLN